ncbi:hypothetical protein KY290_022567 [Solanum tuberosum]|uniref:Uncharacterized protein n=1 Tax=Solanum tuberosum TaxID=4113 RepID=A0ABQ7V4R7_SOLTU|nr:hypothetical protein KY284_021469 [Solanum tuberosum]KAH0759074.1 hypothetical protein KY290_022567 [Solanum tuberosum]
MGYTFPRVDENDPTFDRHERVKFIGSDVGPGLCRVVNILRVLECHAPDQTMESQIKNILDLGMRDVDENDYTSNRDETLSSL